jgi:hypothetical protein
MDLSFCQSEEGFSLDELVVKLADVYERKAFGELLKMILQMMQEILIYRIFHGKIDAMKCCSAGHLLLNSTSRRCPEFINSAVKFVAETLFARAS